MEYKVICINKDHRNKPLIWFYKLARLNCSHWMRTC